MNFIAIKLFINSFQHEKDTDEVVMPELYYECSDSCLLLSLDKVNGGLDGGDALDLIVRDLNLELLLKAHDKLNSVKGVGTKVIHETGAVLEVTIGVQLALDKLADSLLNTLGHEERSTPGGERRPGRSERTGRANKGGEEERLDL